MTASTFYFTFSKAGDSQRAEPIPAGTNRAEGTNAGWAAAEHDEAWQAEQSEFLQLAESADSEALSATD